MSQSCTLREPAIDGIAASATINTARLFRLPEVGYLEPGWHADLVVLAEDPLDDVLAYRRPETVIKAGVVYEGLEQPTMLDTQRAATARPR